jgi:hypothetical protein
MKVGTENRKKTIAAGALMTCAVLAVGYFMYSQFGGDDTPKAAPPPPTGIARAINANNAEISEQTNTQAARSSGGNAAKTGTMPTGNAAGPEAKKIGSSSGNLDPTLDETAMLRTEHLVYSGSGRNIFSLVSGPSAPTKIEQPKFPPRPKGPDVPIHIDPPKLVTCPPQCPPINLKFFGTATRPNGSRQAFLLQGEDVFLASPGDIVARKYKIVSIAGTSIQVEDLTNNNTQTLPLQSN